MASARAAELEADRENAALKKLQAVAGLVDKSQSERLDWMYEQSVASKQKTEMELMNTPIATTRDKDLADIKQLSENTAGSLFLKDPTKTTEDMLRKLREDPLFQIRREEQAARASLMANPLVMARVKKKQEKMSKKDKKKMKKALKKEKKALKKAAKKVKKATRKDAASSSSSSSSNSEIASQVRPASQVPAGDRVRSRSPRRTEGGSLGPATAAALGPSASMMSKREEFAHLTTQRRDAALSSRGAPKRMSEEEKAQRLEEMKADAARHDRKKDERIAAAHQKEKEQEEKDLKLRAKGDQSYFSDMRREAYVGDEGTMADRLKSQRHRRQKNLNDPLERS